MVSLGDVRPVLYIARLFGCGLYIIREDDLVLMAHARVYSLAFALLYASLCATNFYMLNWVEDKLGMKMLALTIARTAISYSCVLSDILMTLARNHKIRAALSRMRSFDRAIGYKRGGTRATRFVYWLVPLVNLSFWSVVGYITFRVELNDSVFNGVTYAIVNACLSMQLITFASLSFLLYKRFRYLCERLLMPEVQLLLWIACMSFNLLSRIYTIGAVTLPLLIAREFLLVSACVVNLLIITIFCHMTAAEANRIGKVTFSPSSAILVKRSFMQDCNVEAAAYFQLRQVNFFAFSGIIRIDLPLLLSIIAGITTYVVILRSASI